MINRKKWSTMKIPVWCSSSVQIHYKVCFSEILHVRRSFLASETSNLCFFFFLFSLVESAEPSWRVWRRSSKVCPSLAGLAQMNPPTCWTSPCSRPACSLCPAPTSPSTSTTRTLWARWGSIEATAGRSVGSFSPTPPLTSCTPAPLMGRYEAGTSAAQEQMQSRRLKATPHTGTAASTWAAATRSCVAAPSSWTMKTASWCSGTSGNQAAASSVSILSRTVMTSHRWPSTLEIKTVWRPAPQMVLLMCLTWAGGRRRRRCSPPVTATRLLVPSVGPERTTPSCCASATTRGSTCGICLSWTQTSLSPSSAPLTPAASLWHLTEEAWITWWEGGGWRRPRSCWWSEGRTAGSSTWWSVTTGGCVCWGASRVARLPRCAASCGTQQRRRWSPRERMLSCCYGSQEGRRRSRRGKGSRWRATRLWNWNQGRIKNTATRERRRVKTSAPSSESHRLLLFKLNKILESEKLFDPAEGLVTLHVWLWVFAQFRCLSCVGSISTWTPAGQSSSLFTFDQTDVLSQPVETPSVEMGNRIIKLACFISVFCTLSPKCRTRTPSTVCDANYLGQWFSKWGPGPPMGPWVGFQGFRKKD